MTYKSKNNAKKSSFETKEIKLVAMTVCSAIAAIVGYSVMTSPKSVAAHRVTADQVKTTEMVQASSFLDAKTDHNSDSENAIVNSKMIESKEAEKKERDAGVDDTKQSAGSRPDQDPTAQVDVPSVDTPKDSAAKTPAQPQEPVVADRSASLHEPGASSLDPALDAPDPTAPSDPDPAPAVETEFEPFDKGGMDGNGNLAVFDDDLAVSVQDSGIPENQIWPVHYVSSWGASSAPADGSVGLWADGWFIAHSNMANGDMIASQPAYVEVDGQIYALRDSWVSDDFIITDEVARARANNGIVFQTCITETTNRLVHYEPVDGPGYPYQFDQFPYTVSDHAILGV